MFGLEGDKRQKKEKVADFVFDLETDFEDRATEEKIKARIQERIEWIKAALRGGESKEEFDRFGQLLHGYVSFLKVMARVKTQKR